MAKRRKASAAQKARLKELRRKYGLGEFSKKKRVKLNSVYTRHSRITSNMARRRKKGFFGRSQQGNSFNREVVGAFLYGAIGENLLDQLAKNFNVGVALSGDLIKGVVGYFVAQRTTGIVKGMGQAAVAVSAYKVGKTGLSFLNPPVKK